MNPDDLQICRIHEGSGTFKKEANKLPKEMKRELELFITEILSGNIPKGRRMKKLSLPIEGIYEARLNLKFRLVFRYNANDCSMTPFSIGSHDVIEKRLKNVG